MPTDNSKLFSMFKSTGTYRVFEDETIMDALPARKTRLLVGQFRKGPVNKALYVRDESELIAAFGQRDKRLEKNGCFSWLIAKQMLAVSPIYIINLRKFDDEKDMLTRMSIATNVAGQNSDALKVPFTQLYDTTNFWQIEPLMLLNKVKGADAQLLNFATITNQSVTIFVVPTANRDYDYPIANVQAQYPSMYVPTAKCEDLLSRYMVDVYFFSQNLTNFANLAGSAKFGKYFDSKGGVRKTVDGEVGLQALSKVADSGFIGRVTGSLLPDLLDINGNKLSLEAAINSVMTETGVVCKINPEAVDQYYNANEVEGARFMRSVDLIGGNLIKIEEGAEPTFSQDKFEYLGFVFDATTTSGKPELRTDGKWEANISKPLDSTMTEDKLNETVFNKFNDLVIPMLNGVPSLTSFYGPVMPLNVGTLFVGADGNPVRLTARKSVGMYTREPLYNTVECPLYRNGATIEAFPQNSEGIWVYPTGIAPDNTPVQFDADGLAMEYSADGNGQVINIPDNEIDAALRAQLTAEHGIKVNVLSYEFDGELWHPAFTDIEASTISVQTSDAEKPIDLPVMKATSEAMRFTRLYNVLDFTTGWYLAGYAPREEQFVNGTQSRQNEVLGCLVDGGVYKSLMDANQIKFRYVVDSFKTYATESNAKWQLSQICNQTKRAIAFAPQPTKYDLMTCDDPYFKKTPTGVLDAAIVAAGGNTGLPYSRLFSFAGQDYGAPFIGYFANVRFNDGIDDMVMPATGIISNAYMRKYNESGRHAWDAVAGPEWPIAGENITDIDWIVSQGQGSDLDSLEPASWNMLQRDDASNITMLSERSAQNSFYSAFSYLSNLELLIYIADEMEPALDAKRFKRNTANARLDILTKANAFMDRVVAAGGCQKYENVCDTSNNDSETIARGFLVLDTTVYVENNIIISVQRLKMKLAE